MFNKKLFITTSFIFFFCNFSWANDNKEDEIIVTATRTEASIASIPGNVQTISNEEIQRQSSAGRKVADILGTLVPALSPSTGTMTNYAQTLRGRNLLVLIDGVPQNASRDTFRQLNSISPESIDRIEIVSGASSLYGAGATGGIINIITKRNHGENLAFSSHIGVTTGNKIRKDSLAYNLFQSATGRDGNFDWYLSGDLTERASLYDSKRERIPQDTSQGSEMDTRSHDLQGRFGYNIDENKRITLGLQQFIDKQSSEYGYKSVKGKAKAVKGLVLDEQPKTENNAINLNYTDNDFWKQRLQIENYWRKQEALFYPDRPRKRAGITATNSKVEVYGIRTSMTSSFPVFNDITGTLTYGFDYELEKLNQEGKQYTTKDLVYTPTGKKFYLGPDINTQNKGAYIQSSILWDDWTFRGGVRQQWITSDIKDSVSYGDIQLTGKGNILPGDKLNYKSTLYNAGVVRHFSNNQELYFNFSQGFTLPDMQRFLRDVRSSFNVSSLDSQAIKVNSYELGWRGDWDTVKASAVVYQNISGVTQYYDATDRVLRLKDQKERIRGVEGSLSYFFDEKWSVGGTYAFTKGETKENGKWIDLPATRISPQKLTGFLDYTGYIYSARLQFMNSGNYTVAANDQNGREIKGYTVVDLLTSMKLPKGKIDLGIYNLMNKDYYTVFMQANARAPWPKAQGRTISIGYSLDW